MTSQPTLASHHSGRRIRIQDRAHAHAISREIAFGELFKNGGTVEGFADWLFVNRKTFNGPNELQQASVYANRHAAAKRRGDDFDIVCRSMADEREEIYKRVEATYNAQVAAIKTLWIEVGNGPSVICAIAELCLGHGYRFANASGEDRQSEAPSKDLAAILKLLEDFGGPDQSLGQYDWKLDSDEECLRKRAKELAKSLPRLRDAALHLVVPSRYDLGCIAIAASYLSCIPRVRTKLRVDFTRAMMIERIGARGQEAAISCPASKRSRRAI